MKKSILSAALGLGLIVNILAPTAAFASQEATFHPVEGVKTSTIVPFWVNVSSITLSMTYSGGAVQWRGIVQGKANTANINANFRLEKQNSNGSYVLVDTWTASTTTTKLDKSASVVGSRGTYRLTVTATVKSTSGVSETVTDSLVKTL